MRKILFKILTLLMTFNGLLLANVNSSEIGSNFSEIIEVSLDSFSAFGIMAMVILTSLLGVYFIKDEFCQSLE